MLFLDGLKSFGTNCKVSFFSLFLEHSPIYYQTLRLGSKGEVARRGNNSYIISVFGVNILCTCSSKTVMEIEVLRNSKQVRKVHVLPCKSCTSHTCIELSKMVYFGKYLNFPPLYILPL